jgi:hypothetical protein
MYKSLLTIVIAVAIAAPAVADPVYFTNKIDFENFNLLDGKFLKGVEDFEESTIPPGAKLAFPAPLQNGVPNNSFPNGITATNLIIQDNTLPGPGAPMLSPSGNGQALFVTGAGFAGSNSKKVGEDMGILFGIHVSTDLIFSTADGVKTGVGFDLSRYSGFSFGGTGFVISVFDTNNVLVGSQAIGEPAAEPSKTFWGVWNNDIGRINIHDNQGNLPEGIDNIQMWIPEPGTLSLLAFGALALLRRRR